MNKPIVVNPTHQVVAGPLMVCLGIFIGITLYRNWKDPVHPVGVKIAMEDEHRDRRSPHFCFILAGFAFCAAICLFFGVLVTWQGIEAIFFR